MNRELERCTVSELVNAYQLRLTSAVGVCPIPGLGPNPTDATSTAPIFIPANSQYKVGQLPSQKQDSLVNECSEKLDFKERNSGPLDLRLISDPDSFMTQTV